MARNRLRSGVEVGRYSYPKTSMLRFEALEARRLLSVTIMLAGQKDNFAGSTESPSPSAALAASDGFELMDFDLVPGPGFKDKKVAHSFDGLDGGLPAGLLDGTGRELITGASLELRARAGPTGGEDNDAVILGFYGAGLEGDVWNEKFEDLTGSWSGGQNEVFTLDLSALSRSGNSPLDLLPLLNDRGMLDVKVKDDTGVDYYELTIEHLAVWDGGGNGSSWHDADNWAFDTLPQDGDEVFIPDVAGTTGVVLSTGTYQLSNLVTEEPLTISGSGSLTLAAASEANAA